MKEGVLALLVLGALVMIVGVISIFRILRGHRSVQLDWSGLGFNLRVTALRAVTTGKTGSAPGADPAAEA